MLFSRYTIKSILKKEIIVDNSMVEKIKSNPSYQKLISERSSFAWKLTITMLTVYYAFILLIAFSPETLGAKIVAGGMATVGIPVGVAIIIFAFILTGIYVKRANSEFDGLLNQVKEDVAKDVK
ncbi:MAG: DUF485 domain-containing protein [Campylobacteraceae bacterium]|jgi:uncharacterized membrane protein (DUF485 family)|nr:DUF485 domain-containing protein [Campylobacteraceae bacterium]MBT3882819.1 DUF485 domain-containing protein [Campylobacteraceae bacterium]MBT4030151.1 DUF485 domain-containing protein [Campylobacteraceae bacterium]MBT4179757.1 DUF485 domain-containing protein [Campylobacteraceae bacterium]MBT4573191.1 DUF485 domain-containing protein [Campylobacteraceae bacterium]